MLNDMKDFWAWLVGGGVIAGFATVVGLIIKAGEEKQKYLQLRDDVDEHEERFKKVVFLEEYKGMQALCQTEIKKIIEVGQAHNEHLIDSRVAAGLKEAQAANLEVFNDLYDQMSTLNGNLCHLMGAMNVKPIRSPKRRRKLDASTRDLERGG